MFRRFVPAVLVCAVLILNVQAQGPGSTEKRSAIQELLTLVGATKTAKTVFVTLIDQYSQALAKNTIENFEKKNWPPASKEKVKVLTQEFFTQLSQRLREEVPDRLQYEERVGRLYLDLYDQYFTEAEIRELIAFYGSPVGRKFLGLAPSVAGSIQQKAQAEFEAETVAVTKEIVAEELKKLEIKLTAELKKS